MQSVWHRIDPLCSTLVHPIMVCIQNSQFITAWHWLLPYFNIQIFAVKKQILKNSSNNNWTTPQTVLKPGSPAWVGNSHPIQTFNLINFYQHRCSGNFLPRGAVNHLPKKFLQVAQIFGNQLKRKEVIRCTNIKNWLCPNFSCCPKCLSGPKFGLGGGGWGV